MVCMGAPPPVRICAGEGCVAVFWFARLPSLYTISIGEGRPKGVTGVVTARAFTPTLFQGARETLADVRALSGWGWVGSWRGPAAAATAPARCRVRLRTSRA